MSIKHSWILGLITSLFLSLIIFNVKVTSTPIPTMIPEMPTHHTDLVVAGSVPQELRDESVYRWMSGSFRIENKKNRGSIFGSGTLCYYDRGTNIAYIITCGHLFEGGEKTVFIDTWYKNGVKLPSPSRYIANVLAFDNNEDIAFLSFSPDWVPNEFFPIAPIDTKINQDTYLWSVGCDNGREVATYKVRVVNAIKGNGSDSFLITRENSPRHGRSGGGLLTNDGIYVGICVRSSDPFNGTGTGLFVPLTRIHAYARRANLNFLLNISQSQINRLGNIPIYDKTGIQGVYPKDYIPVP